MACIRAWPGAHVNTRHGNYQTFLSHAPNSLKEGNKLLLSTENKMLIIIKTSHKRESWIYRNQASTADRAIVSRSFGRRHPNNGTLLANALADM